MHVTSTCIRHKPELKGSTPQFVKYRVKSVNVDIRPELKKQRWLNKQTNLGEKVTLQKRSLY